ncbi:Lrp/AsnC family transcriptional regulator [Paenibacillus sp. WLX1005]|uniref:Lrp/AsnC family transcriptional regulator n=1 Tax=unclassified Paenibacillus TaxID=185978 RepID=UPI0039844EDB
MDHIDARLLTLLQEDARMTISDLSKQLSLSRPSVTERLHRLQERGVIQGFTAIVSPAAIGRSILLMIQISDLKVSASEWEKMIVQEEDVIECHRVTGEIGYIIKAAVDGMEGLRQLVDRLMVYSYVNTSVVLTSPVERRHVLPVNVEE